MSNEACIKAHDAAIDRYLTVRLNPKSTEAQIQAARVEYDRACRQFEAQYKPELAP